MSVVVTMALIVGCGFLIADLRPNNNEIVQKMDDDDDCVKGGLGKRKQEVES